MEQNFTYSFRQLLKPILLLLLVAGFAAQGYGQATLPIYYEGPWGQEILPPGFTYVYDPTLGPLPEDLAPSTSGGTAGFDFVEDVLAVNFNEAPGDVSFSLAFASYDGTERSSFPGSFGVYESADGSTYTLIEAYTDIPELATGGAPYTVTPSASARYIKFQYITAEGATVLLDAISIAVRPVGEPDINVRQGTSTISSGGSYNFGITNVGVPNAKTFTIENIGSVDLQLTGIPIVEVSGTDAGEFSVTTQPATATVAANGNTTFDVTFNPTSFGGKSAVLSISSNDADEPVYTINLSGTGDILPPDITSLSRTSAGAGVTVIVTGTGFSNVSSVTVNGAPALFTVDSPTQITLTVPAEAPNGTGTIRVESPAGFDEEAFTVATAKITSISPISGTINDIVTINGENLPTGRALSVRFSGTTTGATTVGTPTSTQVQVRVPANAITGPISIPINSNYTAQSNTFTVTGPTITSFTPTSGKEGTVVTITGTGYTSTSTVAFAGTNGPVASTGVTYDSPTQLRATVPAGAVTGVISVTVAGRTGQSTTEFVVPTPSITLTGTLSPFATTLNTASASQSYQVSGESLSADIIITAPEAAFQVSLNNFDFRNSVAVTPVNGVVAPTTIYVRYLPTTAGPHGGDITHTSGTASNNLAVEGSVTPVDPVIEAVSPNPSRINQTIVITGVRLSANGEAPIVTFNNIVSTNPRELGTVTEFSETSVSVTVPANAATGTIVLATDNGTATFDNFEVLRPDITVAADLQPFSTAVGVPSAPQTYTVSGANLVESVSITATGNFQISTSEAGTYGNLVNLPINTGNGSLAETTIFVRYLPIATGTESGSLGHTSQGDSESISVSGTAGELSITDVQPRASRILQTIQSSGTRLNGGTLVPVVRFENVIAGQARVEGTVTRISESLLEVTVPANAATGPITVTTTEGMATFNDFTVLRPDITLNANLVLFESSVGVASKPQTYTISGANLVEEVEVVAPSEFQLSATGAEGTYISALTIPLTNTADGGLAETTIFVRYLPTTTGAYEDNIGHTSEGESESLVVEGNGASLPVELVSFKAENKANEVTLLWSTASEKDNAHFDIETSENPEEGFEKIGRVNSKVTNSSTSTNYEFLHRLNSSGTRYYRLKQVDTDGTSEYSHVVAVNVQAGSTQTQMLVVPNPINFNSRVVITAEKEGKATLRLHSSSGKKVYARTEVLQQGENEVQLPVYDQLNSGLYILTVELNGQRHQVKVVKQ